MKKWRIATEIGMCNKKKKFKGILEPKYAMYQEFIGCISQQTGHKQKTRWVGSHTNMQRKKNHGKNMWEASNRSSTHVKLSYALTFKRPGLNLPSSEVTYWVTYQMSV